MARASFGWRVAGAFVRRREASILVVARPPVDLLLAEERSVLPDGQLRDMTEIAAPIALVAAGLR